MLCVFCSNSESKVIDSRGSDDGSSIRRRRECLSCGKRFTTYEKIENIPLVVIKKDKSRQPFDREKILQGLLRACEKRPVSLEQLEALIDGIESGIQNSLKREIVSEEIGEMCLSGLRGIDEVAYVRFASVYRRFNNVDTFMQELTELIKDK